MRLPKSVSLAFAAASLIGVVGLAPAWAQSTRVITNGPQANVEAQSPNWSARQNVIDSHRYEHLVRTDRSFREARMRKECGPISDPQLHASCIASFNHS